MKKNILPIAVVIIIIGLLVAGYFLNGKKSGVNNQAKVAVSEEKKEESLSGKIQDLIASGRSIKCTYTQDKVNNSVIYIKGKNFSGDFLANGKVGHMIYKDSCSWIWSDGEAQGVTMCNKDDAAKNDAFKGIENVPQNVNFNCQPLIGGDDKFNPPSSVNFTDLSGFMKKEQQ